MKKWSIVVVGLVAVSLWSATVYGQHRLGMGWGGRGPGGVMMESSPEMMLPLVLREVDLTAEQEKRVRELMAAHRKTFRTLFSQLRAVNEEMADKLFAPGEVQANDLTPLVQKVAQLREQLAQEGLKVALEVRRVLTPEQLTKAAQLRERMQALHAEMRSLFGEKP